MKFSQYNVVVEIENGLLLLNLKNSSYVKITKQPDLDKFKKMLKTNKLDKKDEMVSLLYQNGYIVSKNEDEYKVVYSKINEIVRKQEAVLDLTLYVTDQCNFRCIYCPEKHKPTRMSDEIWSAVYKYIEERVVSGELKQLCFTFFGGEPLLDSKRIILFLEKIDELSKKYNDVSYLSTITTNGYLLTPKVYDRLTELNVKQYQITVDGDEESHNKMRPRVDGSGTWNKIIENLKYINQFDDGVEIVLRTNHNHINEPKLEDFYLWAKDVFNNSKFVVSLNPVGKLSDDTPEDLATDVNSKEVKKLRNKMELLNKDRTVAVKHNPLELGASICTASNRNCFIVATDGRIAKCNDVYTGDNDDYVGYLSTDGKINYYKDISRWYENCEHIGCKKCAYYPICGARSCPAKKVQNVFRRNDCIAMKNGFKDHVLSLVESGVLL